MTTAADVLRAAVPRLRAAGVTDPARDARLMLGTALGLAAGRLTLALGEPVPEAARAAFARMVAERALRRPVAQIIGHRAFWGRAFEVTANVLDPRPETEMLIVRALADPPAARLLDLGTGSGILAITLLAEWPQCQGVATDLSTAALAMARRNAKGHGVAARLGFVQADWGAGIAGRFDLVVSNPPYIARAELAALAPEVRDWEPRGALSPGPTGLEAYQRIAGEVAPLLAQHGRALVEIGASQGCKVAAIFRAAGFGAIAIHADLDGRDRVIEVAR